MAKKKKKKRPVRTVRSIEDLRKIIKDMDTKKTASQPEDVAAGA